MAQIFAKKNKKAILALTIFHYTELTNYFITVLVLKKTTQKFKETSIYVTLSNSSLIYNGSIYPVTQGNGWFQR